METVGVIVAKAESQRLPRKVFLEIGGETLVARKIRILQECSRIDRIVLGTDSEEIAEIAERMDAEVLWRDEYHCDESRCSANEMIHDVCSRITGDVVAWLHPTNPLVRAETIDEALRRFAVQGDEYDSICSVVAVKEHLWQDGRPFNFDPWAPRHVLAKELPPLFMQNGAIFIQSRENMVESRYFYGRRPELFEMDPTESVDINEYRDYLLAQAMYADMIRQTDKTTS